MFLAILKAYQKLRKLMRKRLKELSVHKITTNWGSRSRKSAWKYWKDNIKEIKSIAREYRKESIYETKKGEKLELFAKQED